MKPALLSSLLLALLALPPSASAGPVPPLPPQDFQAAYDPANHTVTLTWLPPDLDHDYQYLLHRGSTELGLLGELSYTDTNPTNEGFYWIQTVRTDDGLEQSAVQQASAPVFSWIIIDGNCPLVIVGTSGVAFHWECL